VRESTADGTAVVSSEDVEGNVTRCGNCTVKIERKWVRVWHGEGNEVVCVAGSHCSRDECGILSFPQRQVYSVAR